jgi:hypothetical protein
MIKTVRMVTIARIVRMGGGGGEILVLRWNQDFSGRLVKTGGGSSVSHL